MDPLNHFIVRLMFLLVLEGLVMMLFRGPWSIGAMVAFFEVIGLGAFVLFRRRSNAHR